MSDAGHRDEAPEINVDTHDLLSRFRNAREALPEKAIASPGSDSFHRREAESDAPAPACQVTHATDFHAVRVDEALLAGLDPCRQCWRGVLEYLAVQPDSPVEYRSPNATPEPSGPTTDEPFPPEEDDKERPRLSSVTDEVMIQSGSKYHAPAGDETLCGRTGYRVVDRRVLKGQYDPCRNCFTDDDVEE